MSAEIKDLCELFAAALRLAITDRCRGLPPEQRPAVVVVEIFPTVLADPGSLQARIAYSLKERGGLREFSARIAPLAIRAENRFTNRNDAIDVVTPLVEQAVLFITGQFLPPRG